MPPARNRGLEGPETSSLKYLLNVDAGPQKFLIQTEEVRSSVQDEAIARHLGLNKHELKLKAPAQREMPPQRKMPPDAAHSTRDKESNKRIKTP